MSLTFTRTLRVETVLTDADSTPTIGIIRLDTSAVVVASGTAMTHDSTGHYSYTLSSPVAGVTYRATFSIVVNGDTITSTADRTATSGATGTYADQTDVQDLIGEANLSMMGDLDDDGDLDSGLVQRALDASDGYIALKLKAAGITLPVDMDDDTNASVLKQASARYAVWYIASERGIQNGPAPFARGTATIGGTFAGYKTFCDELLAALIQIIAADDGSDTTQQAGGFSFVPINDGHRTCDENSRCA